MDKFNIIGALRAYASNNDWAFLCGPDAFQNYESSQYEYYNGQLILGVNFSANPIINNGAITEIQYPGLIFLGQKFDNDGTPNIEDDEGTPLVDETQTFNDGTAVSLDETVIQKYDRRLYSLMTLLTNAVKEFACNNELDITNFRIDLDINKYDANLDFVGGSITFIQ